MLGIKYPGPYQHHGHSYTTAHDVYFVTSLEYIILTDHEGRYHLPSPLYVFYRMPHLEALIYSLIFIFIFDYCLILLSNSLGVCSISTAPARKCSKNNLIEFFLLYICFKIFVIYDERSLMPGISWINFPAMIIIFLVLVTGTKLNPKRFRVCSISTAPTLWDDVPCNCTYFFATLQIYSIIGITVFLTCPSMFFSSYNRTVLPLTDKHCFFLGLCVPSFRFTVSLLIPVWKLIDWFVRCIIDLSLDGVKQPITVSNCLVSIWLSTRGCSMSTAPWASVTSIQGVQPKYNVLPYNWVYSPMVPLINESASTNICLWPVCRENQLC